MTPRIPLRRTRLAALACAAGASVAAPALGSTQVALIGDAGVDNANQAAVATMASGWAPDALVLLGDNYYSSVGLPWGTGRYDRTVGKYHCAFMRGAAVGPNCAGGTSLTNRLWPIAGNHEYSDGGIANYLAYFSLPGNERYYDVRVGDVHFFMLDTDEALRSPADMAAQKAWLEESLRASDAPFQMVALHHPPYTSSARGPATALRWPFAQWGADMVVSGHDHFYERLDVGGTPYVVNGIGGQSSTAFPGMAVVESRAHWSGSNGAMRLRATEQSMTAEFLSVDGVVRDAVTVTRADTPAPNGAANDGAAPAKAGATLSAGRVTARRVAVSASGRASVRLWVALGSSPAGSQLRAAVTVRRSGRLIGRAAAARAITKAESRAGRATVTVRMGMGASRLLDTGQRVQVASVVTVTPRGGAVATGRTVGAARVRAAG